jgi:hypothetical protein
MTAKELLLLLFALLRRGRGEEKEKAEPVEPGSYGPGARLAHRDQLPWIVADARLNVNHENQKEHNLHYRTLRLEPRKDRACQTKTMR